MLPELMAQVLAERSVGSLPGASLRLDRSAGSEVRIAGKSRNAKRAKILYGCVPNSRVRKLNGHPHHN